MDHRRQLPVAPLLADVAAVLLFAVVGTRSHDGGGVSEVLVVAAPFLIGAALGWLLSPSVRAAPTSTRAGLQVWAATVVVGLLARRLIFDRGTALSFVIVAMVVLAVLLIGWRWIVASRLRRRAVRSTRPPSRAER